MIKRIKISGYKSLVDVEVKLRPLSVLFGPNSAGKSNFLDALQVLARIATSRTLKEAFEPPYRGTPIESFTFGPRGIQSLIDEESAAFSIEVDVVLSPAVIEVVNRQIREMRRGRSADEVASERPNHGVEIKANGDKARANGGAGEASSVRERYLRYKITVEITPKSGILQVSEEYLAALNTRGEPTGKRKPFLELMQPQSRLYLRMEGQAHPMYYERYLDHSILSLPHYPPHYPHLIAMRQELASWLFFYFEPRERMRSPNPVKEVRHIGLMGEELASFLNTLKALDNPQFQAVQKALHTLIPSITSIDVGVNSLGEVELKVTENGVTIPARVLSEGTLRILGLLAIGGAKEPPALIGFEEPENGVHPPRIRHIAEFLRTRADIGQTQVIATTHSPLLIGYIPNESLYIFRREEGRTVIEPFEPTWGHLGRRADIDKGFDDQVPPLSVSERLLRGDFDA
ncbi:MAG: AAA family ATPase [Blastocatellales bacterium]|nr:AAA family ATPase [Blastocatellales bacterium]